MTKTLEALGKRLRFNGNLLQLATDGFGDTQWGARPEAGANSAHWVLGHVTWARLGMLRMAGEAVEEESWEAAFGRGAKPDDGSGYPPVEELVERFGTAGERLYEVLSQMDEEKAQSAVPFELPDGSKTVEDGLHFLYFHETYHLGQIGYIRRLGGLKGFI